jgi:hypothetical protein
MPAMRQITTSTVMALILLSASGRIALGQTPAEQPDPFGDVAPKPNAEEPQQREKRSFFGSLFHENFGFRKEIMSQFDVTQDGNPASRQSVGFEILKKFSTETSTIASFNFQGRLVRRDGFNPVQNDMEGQDRQGWFFEYHNLYLDFYNVLNPFLSDEARNSNVGRFNFRFGRFYVPFGLNLQTDTHGTVLQLSNEQNFGFERDWYTGFWGSLNKYLNYDVYYLVGSGYDLKYKGQSGLGALRISLANQYSSNYGLEGGVSILGGQRLSSPDQGQGLSSGMNEQTQPLTTTSSQLYVIDTRRAGIDGRYRHAVPNGVLTFSSELSGGRDNSNSVFTQLYQTEYLHRSRRWGLATQYRRFGEPTLSATASIIGEATWYFRNDVGNSNLHWIKLNVEHQLERITGRPDTVITLQYYFYR